MIYGRGPLPWRGRAGIVVVLRAGSAFPFRVLLPCGVPIGLQDLSGMIKIKSTSPFPSGSVPNFPNLELR